jgi:NAD-dependent dihydropyrimidine dehydrogenase PreA subunit
MPLMRYGRNMKRKIITIDQIRCNGCGECIPLCKEGALRIVNGKAALISEAACDGLAACLGTCPRDAIRIDEREAAPFNPKAAEAGARRHPSVSGCPGAPGGLKKAPKAAPRGPASKIGPRLSNWPIQIRLVPVDAPYFRGAHLLIAADCVPFAFPDFHNMFVQDRIVLSGCPKLDDIGLYQDKISRIIAHNAIQSVVYVHMEVPCCMGMIAVIQNAVKLSGKDIPFETVEISINGEASAGRSIV